MHSDDYWYNPNEEEESWEWVQEQDEESRDSGEWRSEKCPWCGGTGQSHDWLSLNFQTVCTLCDGVGTVYPSVRNKYAVDEDEEE